MALTASQLERLRRDLGDSNTPPAFDDTELNDNWDRLTVAGLTETQQHEATLALCFRQLLAQATKFHNYTAGQVKEDLKQVRDNIKDMFELFKPALDAATSQNRQLVFSKIGKRAHADRVTPLDAYDSNGDVLS